MSAETTNDVRERDEALRNLLCDSFGRVRERVAAVTDGLSLEMAAYRADDDANTIGWLVWHLTRIQDDHVSELAGVEQVWSSGGWIERFGLPFGSSATGYGQSSDEVGAVTVEPDLLDRYQADVHRRTVEYLTSLTAEQLAEVVDDSWDPPVTVSVRLVSVLGDCLQHAGQAANVRGLAERASAAEPTGAGDAHS